MQTSIWTEAIEGRLTYDYANFALAKAFFFDCWQHWAAQRQAIEPRDLSGSCKYGSLFMRGVFGGALRGHYQHQYNIINGRMVDLSHDALDVAGMADPYLHEPEYFKLPELQSSLTLCLPRAEAWAQDFIDQREGTRGRAPVGHHQ